MATKMIDCEYTKAPDGWRCEGNGNLCGERSFGHGVTKQAAYEDYRRVLRQEEADMIEDDAEEAEMVQDEIRREGGDQGDYGTSLRDGLMAVANTRAMRERAKQLREAGTSQP